MENKKNEQKKEYTKPVLVEKETIVKTAFTAPTSSW